jgi:hypothetical protein
MTVNWSRGMVTSMFLRLCSRAPRTTIAALIQIPKTKAYPHDKTRPGRRAKHALGAWALEKLEPDSPGLLI